MKQKFTMLAATMAMGFLLAGPAAADVNKQGGGSDAPPGMGSDWGGSGGCNSSCGGHDKNGGGGHNKNGGGVVQGGGGGGGGGGNNINCVVGGRVVEVVSVRQCRKLVARYSYGVSYGYGEGYGHGGGYRDGYGYGEPSYATRMQVRKRARHQAYGNGHSVRKVHSRKRHGRRAARRGYGSGKVIIVNNYGGYVEVNKNGGY